MPQIKPTSVQDLLKFIEDHRSEIENRTYELIIESNWVPQISEDTLLFLIKHCPAIHRVIASSMSTSPRVLEVLATRTGTVAVARMDIASNLNTASRVLEVLSRDTEIVVRIAVASNLKGIVRLLVLTPFVRLIRKRFPNRQASRPRM